MQQRSDNPISTLACLDDSKYDTEKFVATAECVIQAEEFVIEATKEGENADVNNLFSLLAKCAEM